MAEKLSTAGVLSAAQQDVRLPLAGMGGVAIQVQGSFTGTISFEASIQGQAFEAFRVTPSDSSTATDDTTTTGLWSGSTVGYTVIRARMSAYTNGAATVLMQAILPPPGGAGGGGGTGSDVNLIEVGGASIALGQTTMADSLPVVIASDQSAIDVTSADFGDPFPADGFAIGVNDPGGTMQPLSAETLDFDSGAGTVAQTIMGIALPGSGGPVAGGTPTNPLRVDEPGDYWTYHYDSTNTAVTDAVVKADPGDGFQIVVTSIAFSSGTGTAINIFFEEGSTKILGPWYLEAVAGRGVIWVGHKKVTASTALTVTTSIGNAQSIDVQGYVQAV